METIVTDAIVIGSGPGGYVAAVRLGQLGKQVVCIEKGEPGGVCLNVGCIPSKALITAAKNLDKARHGEQMGILADNVRIDMAQTQKWKGEVVKKLTGGIRQLVTGHKGKWIWGTATVVAPNAVEVEQTEGKGRIRIEAPAIIVATGSRPIQIPGFTYDGKRVFDSTGALDFAEVPKRLCVIGGGYIGMELGMMYAKLGTAVTIVEGTSQILPGNDPEIVQVVAKKAKKLGMEMVLDAKAKGWVEKDGQAVVTFETKDGEKSVAVDKILVTVGRKPSGEGLGLEKLGVKVERGFVPTDRQMRTNVPGIYAIGDVAGQPMLAHKASKEADVVAEVICGKPAEMDTNIIPAVIFTDPEIATVGLSEADATKAGRKVRVGKYPFGAHGRSLTSGETDGFVKIVADEATEEILGIQIVGAGACDLISEGALALEMGAYLPDMALTIHPHPTLGEAMMEAAKAALGESPHIVGGGQRAKR